MSTPNIMVPKYAPLIVDDSLSISQFMTKYNPDNVATDKLVHIDTITGKSLTYGGLRTEAAKGAWGLRHKLGLMEGDVLSLLCPNSTDFVLLVHATWWAGGVISPMNTSSTAKDLAQAFDVSRPTHIGVYPEFLKTVQDAIRATDMAKEGKLPTIFTVLERVNGLPKFPEDISGQRQNETLPVYDLGGRSAKDVCSSMCFSSGTTGKMKGVMLSHQNLIANTLQYRMSLPSLHNASQREVFFAPYCHIYGFATIVMQGMWFGNFTCALPAFGLDLFCSKMAEYKATWSHIVPPVALLIAHSENLHKYDLSSLKFVMIAAAPLKKSLQDKLISRLPGALVCQGYGLSECSPAVTYQHPNDGAFVGTVGKLFSGTEARLVDPDTGKDAKAGEEGELWVRGPQVMMGYAKNEEATRSTFVGDWLRTGDIMKVDKHGNFYVTDRLKEMIKYKGFQVAPSELEDLLLRHPDVIDAAVCAVYDPKQASEIPLAYVSLTAQHAKKSSARVQAVLDDIRKWFDGQVAGYKKLRGGIYHLQSLPKTTSGKILRRSLPAKIKEQRVNML